MAGESRALALFWKEAGVGLAIGLGAATVYNRLVSARDGRKIRAYYAKQETANK